MLSFLSHLFSRFQFLDPGPLVDRDLELIAPHERWADALLAACRHPLTVQQAPLDAQLTSEQLHNFLEVAPGGHEKANSDLNRVPTYHFWMLIRPNPGDRSLPPLRIAGAVGLRIGRSFSLEQYYGHLGYHVYPAARGRHYAERACRLLLPLARRHRINPLWITCNPDNVASARTCQRLGARYTETVAVPEEDPLYLRGDTHKCRYRLDL